MSKSRKKQGRHPLLALILVLVVLLLLALPWLYLRFADFSYDDWKAMAAGNREPFDFADLSQEAELSRGSPLSPWGRCSRLRGLSYP